MYLAELFKSEILPIIFQTFYKKNTQFWKFYSQSAKPLDMTDTQFVLLPTIYQPSRYIFLHKYALLHKTSKNVQFCTLTKIKSAPTTVWNIKTYHLMSTIKDYVMDFHPGLETQEYHTLTGV